MAATLILAAFWVLWHLPSFFVVATYRAMGVVAGVGFAFSLSCGAVVLTWLYNRSGGSILLVAIWHGLFNVASGTQAATGVVAAVVTTPVMVLAFVLVALHLRARHRKQPTPLRAAQAAPDHRRTPVEPVNGQEPAAHRAFVPAVLRRHG